MYKVGYLLEYIGHPLPNFTIGNRYEIILIKENGAILIIDDNEKIFPIYQNRVKNYFELVTNKNKSNSNNNGGSTDYYKFKENWKECQDIIEDREMNFSQGNIFKSAFCFNIGRHSATDYTRELNKIIYFANRELERIKNERIN